MKKTHSQPRPETWLDRYGNDLFAYAAARLPRRSMAEDMVQETFLAALKGLDGFRGNSSERTWLFSIIKRKIIDFYRRQAANPQQSFSDYIMPFHTGGKDVGHWIESRAPGLDSIEEQIEGAEFYHVMQICIEMLPPRHRMVFILKVMDEYDSQTVCDRLGMSKNNFWTIMHRARLQLRECIEKKGF